MVTGVKKLTIQSDRDRVVTFCRDRTVFRLSFFDSVLRDAFAPAGSDIDVLAGRGFGGGEWVTMAS